jgi:GTPase SAR1 family protein
MDSNDLKRRIAVIDRTVEVLAEVGLHPEGETAANDLRVLHVEPSIAVIGLVSRGKSTLVNKLLGVDVQPMGPNPVTFGCGFLRSGHPRAIGIKADGSRVDLPSDPEGFRHVARRHEAQDVSDFEYTWNFRLPRDVVLIDTKGLDEVSADFQDDLLEMERSWAAQGAVSALLVTAVPPGASARDVTLFRALSEHFEGRVTVIVKQVDSTLTLPELEEAAGVWRSYSSDVLVIPDSRPTSNDQWGFGPLAALERKMSDTWSRGDDFKSAAVRRLERTLADLAKNLEVPFQSRRAERLRTVYFDAVGDQSVHPEVRSVLADRLIVDYQQRRRSLSDAGQIDEAFYLAELGSTHARSLLLAAMSARSSLRKGLPLDQIIEVIYPRNNSLSRQALEAITLDSDADFCGVSRMLDRRSDILRAQPSLWADAKRYCSSVVDEVRLLHLLRSGGDLTSVIVVMQLIDVWELALDGHHLNVSSAAVINTALKTHEHELRLRYNKIDQHLYRLFSRLEQVSVNWGQELVTQHSQNLSKNIYSQFTMNRRSHTPFDEYAVIAGRIEQVIARLQLLMPYVGEQSAGNLRAFADELGPMSRRQRWLRESIRISRFDIDHRLTVADAYKWTAAAVALLGVIFLTNRIFAASVFFGAMALLLGVRSLVIRGSGLMRVETFDSSRDPISLQRMAARHWIVNAAFGVVSIALAVSVSVLTRDGGDGSASVVELVPASQAPVETTAPTVPPVAETSVSTTTASLVMPTISSEEVGLDQFQDGRGVELSATEVSSDSASTVSYVFVLRSVRNDLPDVMDATACWVNEIDEGLGRGCQSVELVRFSQVQDKTAFALQAQIDSQVSPGVNRLKITPTSLYGDLLSSASILVTNSGTGMTSTTSGVQNGLPALGIEYANAMADWSSTGFKRMMSLSAESSPAWNYGFHLLNGRLSELQAGRKDGSSVRTILDPSGVRLCVTSSCDLRLSDFIIEYGMVTGFSVNGRAVSESVIADPGSSNWVCGESGACVVLRSLSWFGAKAYATVEVQVSSIAVTRVQKAAIRLVTPTGRSISFSAGTTPDARPGVNAHYSISFPTTQSPFGGEIRVKVRTDIGLESIALPVR